MNKLDCLGEICPIPILKLQKQLDQIYKGEALTIVTDHSCTLGSVRDFCKGHGLTFTVDEVITGVWEITVSRNTPA